VAEYQYRCNRCNRLFASGQRADAITCPDCQGHAPRKFSFYVQQSMKEHFNNAVGSYVSNHRQFEDGLKRKSEEASVRLGIDHEFVPLSPAEMADASAHGVDENTIESTRKNQHDHPELYRP
jgi:hypothetical protein